ncbi:MAG: hypothetical protein WC389_18115 [Lutibacter sp.]
MNENLLNITVTTAELAAHFGVSEKYLSELHREQGLPKAGHDAWPLIACDLWRFNNIKEIYENRLEKAFSEKGREKLDRVNAELKEIELLKAQEQIIMKSAVMDVWIKQMSVIVNNLDGLPIRVADKLIDKKDIKEIIDILTTYVNQTKKQISETKIEL